MRNSMYKASLWSGKNTKLSILVPTKDTVYSQFAYCLTQLVKTTSEAGLDVYVFFDSSTILLNQREKLIQKALEIESNYVLWLDSDMMFPSTTAIRLLSHKKNIVGCNYMKRSIPQTTVAYQKLGDWNSWLPLEPQDRLIKVEGVGMGCILMKTNIFHELKKPYFEFTYQKKTKDWFGEDFNLLKKLRNKNHDVYIDTVLSMDIKHLGLFAYGVQ